MSTLARRQAVEEILEAGRRMYDRQLIVACQGNLSARISARGVLTTPAGVCKGKLTEEELIEVDFQGRPRSGKPSSELAMHLAIYRVRDDVGAVVHGHPPWATAFATAGRALDRCLLPEVIAGLGSVPLSRYATPGTGEVAEAVCEYIDRYDAVLMPNHGVVACGRDVLSALYKLETVEHLARITLIAEMAGGPKVLSRGQVQALGDEAHGVLDAGAPLCRAEGEGPGGTDPVRGGGSQLYGEEDLASGGERQSPEMDSQRLARIVAEEVARGLGE